MKTTYKNFIRLPLFLVATIAASGYAEKAKPSFESEVGRYLAGHSLSGVKTCEDLKALIAAPCGEAAKIEATVQPRHAAKKVRCWGSMMLPFFKKWGLDVAELDPDALARGELPDVIFVTQHPYYTSGDVEMLYRAAAEGVHVVTLCGTDAWSGAFARRLGFSYGGVLTINGPEKGGVAVPNCPKLFEGLPQKPRLDAEFAAIPKWIHGMYLTGDRSLMTVADSGQRRIATAIAQYAVGRGAVTLVGPRFYETPDVPLCKRMLLNLVDLLPPAPKALNMPFVYHPVPPEGKPYFELLVPGTSDEYLTQARPRDHVWHLAFFYSWKFINGRNFWEPRDRGAVNRVVSHSERATSDGAVFEAELSYELDGRAILREHRTVKATVKPNGDYSFDWTGRFEALEKLAFTASIPKWDKAKGTNNYCGYAGFSARLAGSGAFTYAYTNAVGSVDAHCYGDVSPRIDVYAKSKRTGDTTRLSFIADRPTANYTLHQPQTYKGAGFYFIAFPEMFNTTLEMAKGEKRDFHYVLEVAKSAGE